MIAPSPSSSTVGDSVEIRQRISVDVSVISTAGRNLRSLTFVRDDNAGQQRIATQFLCYKQSQEI